MNANTPLLILDQTCDAAIEWVATQITNAGMRVVRTFDLQVARHDHSNCPCPHHGTQHCDCQMVILLVYGIIEHQPSEQQPVSIIAHGYNGQTWFSVVNTPQQRADPEVEAAIHLALVPRIPPTSLGYPNQSHAA